jgi:hypothetical protein
MQGPAVLEPDASHLQQLERVLDIGDTAFAAAHESACAQRDRAYVRRAKHIGQLNFLLR